MHCSLQNLWLLVNLAYNFFPDLLLLGFVPSVLIFLWQKRNFFGVDFLAPRPQLRVLVWGNNNDHVLALVARQIFAGK